MHKTSQPEKNKEEESTQRTEWANKIVRALRHLSSSSWALLNSQMPRTEPAYTL